METNTFDFYSFKQAGEDFMRSLTAKMADVGIPAQDYKSDHLCFRVGTAAEYDYYKVALSAHGKLLTEARVNGRAISTFLLTSPFQTESHQIRLVELPSPKSGAVYATGFEHAEFVTSECFSSLRARFPHLEFIEGGNKNLNPELCLKLDSGVQVKFHHHSLERIIELEEATITDVIFDFDGTLIKSREKIYEVNRVVFSNILGRQVSLQESIDNFHPEFSKLFEAFEVSCPQKRSEAIASWGLVSSQFSYELFDGVVETLKAFKDRGLRLHLWTARDEFSARKVLHDHGLEEFFATLSFATEIDSKPHANSLAFAWKLVGKDRAIVIGDSSTDIIGAKNIFAIRGAAIWDGYSKKKSLIEAGAELFFYDLASFKDWVINSAAITQP